MIYKTYMMPLTSCPDMSLASAELLAHGVRQHAASLGRAVAVVVVDRGGNLVTSARMDGSQLGASSLALDKAYTAVAFGRPTSAWSQSSSPGASDWGLVGSLSGRTSVIAGGVPVYVEGQLVGGVGVSGGPSAIDEECAEKSLAAAGASSQP